MNDLKLSGKKVKDLRHGDMIEKDDHYFKVGSDRVAKALQELGDDRINQTLNEKEN